MSDDLRDKFGSDDEYEDFLNSYNDYKNKEGMFQQPDIGKYIQDELKKAIQIEELIYKNFILEKKQYFKLPETFFGVKNMSLYMFHIEKMETFDEVVSIFMN